MPYFKDKNNQLHFLDCQDDAAKYLPGGCVEITDAEAEQIRISSLPVPDRIAEKAAVLAEFRKLRDTALARLNGIQMDSTVQADIDAIKVAKQGLKDMPQHATVVAAVGGDATEDALRALYAALSIQLYQSAPAAYTAFRGLDL